MRVRIDRGPLLKHAWTLADSPWKRHVIDDSSQGADGVRFADFNRDGRMDIVTGWEQGGITRIYLQPEQAEVKQRWPAVTVGHAPSVEDAVAVDLDDDGFLDVISSTEGKSRTLFVHWSPSNAETLLDETAWKTEAIPASVEKQAWMYCLPMDVDGENGVDFVAGSKNPNAAVGWWQSPGNARDLKAWKYHKLIDAGWIMSLLADDVDNDGDLDVILTDRKTDTRGLKWLERRASNNVAGATAWKEHVIGGTNKELMFAVVRDLDQDGAKDILVTTRDGTTELYRRLPSSVVPKWEAHSVPNPFGYQHSKSIACADLNRNGQLDLVQTLRPSPAKAPAVGLMQCVGNPFSATWTVTDIGGPDGSKFDLIEAVDLDCDGDQDLVTCEEVANLGVVWYENPTF